MKRYSSRDVSIGFLALAAVSIAVGCEEDEVRQCVDEHQLVVADERCTDAGAGGGTHIGGHVYHYFYGGYTPIGSRVSTGSFTPVAGHSYVPHASVSVSRGGFGRAGSISSPHAGGFGGAHGSVGS